MMRVRVNETQTLEIHISAEYMLAVVFVNHFYCTLECIQTPNKKHLRIQAEALSTGQGEVLSTELGLRLNVFPSLRLLVFSEKAETRSDGGNT